MSKSSVFQYITGLALALLTLAAGGCGGRYQMGAPSDLPFASIYVTPVINESFAPQAHTVLSGQIRSLIIEDGRVRLVTDPRRADAVLVVTLEDFSRSTDAVAGNDTARALSTELDLGARFTLYRGDSAQTFFEDRIARVSGSVYNRNLSVGTPSNPALQRQDSLESESQLIPLLTRDLAREIVNAIIHPW